MKKSRYISFITSICLLLLLGCSRNEQPISKSGMYFDTIITITVYHSEDEPLLDKCFSMAEYYENLFSKTIETSDIYQINHSQGTPTEVHEETFYLLEKALDYAAMTEGAIDPTILPLSDLWNFGENETVPKEEDIAFSLSQVGYENVILDSFSNTVTLKKENMGIDLGFIAKGYIADKMKEYLISEGVESALINLGGNVLTIGNKPDGSAYTLGVREPFGEANSSITTVKVTDKSLVSSGVYERYFYEDDVLYHHILDTSTGYPVNNGLFAVTILSDFSMEGDAYSTICMCLGLEDGMELIESTEGIEALFITEDMELVYSSGFPKN